MAGAAFNHFEIRADWLAGHREEALNPEQPVVDAHHHLYDRPALRYLLDEYRADLADGHDVRASVFVQARAMLRADGPEAFRAVGETEFVNGVAAMSASGLYGPSRLCAGIVGYADLTLGDAVRPVLEAHVAAGGGRFRGIRHTLCWDDNAQLLNPAYPTIAGMAGTAAFRAGFAHLAPLGLGFEAWCFFHQLPEVAQLARDFPGTRIVVNHCGGIIGAGSYRREAVRAAWLQGIRNLATCPNVSIKLSGLGMRLGGFGFDERPQAPSSVDLASAWAPWVLPLVEHFGADRCLWGSNFPVDKGCYAYGVGLNAYKRLLEGCSPSERDAIFRGNAARYYQLPSAGPAS